MGRMFDEMEKKTNKTATPPAAPARKSEPSAEPAPGAEDDDVPAEPAAAEPAEDNELGEDVATTPKEGEPKPGTVEKKKGINPWKELDTYKKQLAQKEREFNEFRRLNGDPETRKSEIAKVDALEKRAKELEDHIRYLDYQKHPEYAEKYEKPYEAKWASVMSELAGVSVLDEKTGQERPVKPADMLALVNMPLTQAGERADELFGHASGTVMAFRTQLKDLFNAKQEALTKAKTEGAEKMKKESEERQRTMADLQKFSDSEWEVANKAITEHEQTGKYFRPDETDTDFTTRLEKGYKFVDDTMAMNPFDPKLPAEERSKIIRKHASIRARAAAFGANRYRMEVMAKQLNDLKAKLAQYESSEPDTGGSLKSGAAPASGGRKIDQLNAALEKLATRG
jgi:hypothetical protein